MAYPQSDDPDLVDDLLHRKEFYWTKRWENDKPKITDDIIPRFMLDDEIAKSGYLKLLGHQSFIENYFNPSTDYKRLHLKWSTGSGKTLGSLAIAMNFIKNYNIERELGHVEIGSVFVIGFSERAFKNELSRYPEFGFLSKDERVRLDKLKRLASVGNKNDLEKYQEMVTRVKKRFSNRKGNGFFRFFGYKAFVNRIFVAGPDININDLSEDEIRTALKDKRITYNETLMAEFKNSLIICDEIHNVYNSAEKNNWGIAIQAVLDYEPTVRCVTLSATPLNNSPAEIIDLLNLLLPANKRVKRSDFFIGDRDLKPGALEKIAALSRGRFSFLIDVNPKYYPKIINIGKEIKTIPYLKFIRCPMSPFHYKTYKAVYQGTLAQDSQYLVDFALPNPEDPNGIGIYQTNQIKKLLANAPQKWKDKYGLDYRDNKIVGDALLRDNLVEYSSKYTRVLDEIFSDIRHGNGKIFIYHNVVHMSGVLFIEQMLIRNGFLDEFSTSSDNTICMRCGKTKKQHGKSGGGTGGTVGDLVCQTSGGFEDNGIDEYGSTQKPSDTESVADSEYESDRSSDTSSGPEDMDDEPIDDTDDEPADKTPKSINNNSKKKKAVKVVDNTDHTEKPVHVVKLVDARDPSSGLVKIVDDREKIAERKAAAKKSAEKSEKSDEKAAEEITGSADNCKLPPMNSTLIRDGSTYIWKLGEKHILSIKSKKKPYKHYWIPLVHDDLLNLNECLLDTFKEIITKFSNRDIIIRFRNSLGKKFGEWLLNHGFTLKSHEGTHSILIKRGIFKSVSGGASKLYRTKLGGKSNRITGRTFQYRDSPTSHVFTPARFVMAHSDIDKPQMEHSLEKFSNIDNVDGSQFLILVGSKIIKESFDIKAIQNLYVTSRPDNMPTFIQIRGRAVRKNSHKGLPPEKHVVHVKIFTTCLPIKYTEGPNKSEYKFSYEEEKYQEKIAAFQIIQKIEKVIHENSIDAVLNYGKIQKSIMDDPLGPLPYTPKDMNKYSKEFDISQLNLATFNIHHAYKEVETIKIIIKRLFIEISSAWEYKDLFSAVRNPPYMYEHELNTRLFTENNFLIALSQLVWDNSPGYVEPFIHHGDISEDSTNIDMQTGPIIYNAPDGGDKIGGIKLGGGAAGGSVSGSVDGGIEPSCPCHLDSDSTLGGCGSCENHSAVLAFDGGSAVGGFDTTDSAIMGGSSTSSIVGGFETNVFGTAVGGSSDGSITGGGKIFNRRRHKYYLGPSKQVIPAYIIDHLYDSNDKIVALPGGQDSVIVPIQDNTKQYYILFPINRITNMPDIDIELPYRIVKQEEAKSINMNSFIQTKRIDFDYDDKKKIFFRKYADIAIENMENVVCEYGTTFHIKFIEECIEYVFNAWTSPTIEKSEYHEFYFKMLYYYDLMSLVMWAYTSKPRVFKEYTKYAIPVKAKDIKLKTLSKYENRPEELTDISPDDNSDLASSGVINLLKSTFNRTSNAWIPAEFREQYDKTVEKSLALFMGRRKKSKGITKVSADLLPIGHYISKFPRLYLPDKGWDENPTYLQNETEYKENNIIVGFDERSTTGVHIRFKIRNPIHNIKKYKDSRQTEKGTVCKSKSKDYLKMVAKKLDAVVPDKINVDELCVIIRSKLIRLELKERIAKSTIKYFYFFYEQRPETR